MAISSYLRECGYELGGLLPKIYLVHKNALKLSKKAKGLEVSVVSRNDGDIYCVEGQLCTYKQDETYNGKYRFNSTLELTINELYREPFLYGLRTLRTNEYYIIIEDKKGVQYLINPELYTKMSYEYSFSDTSGNNNHIIITYNNLSNYPLLIFEENISDNKSLLNKQCEYNYGQAYELLMFDHKDLKVKDDGVKVDEMYIENVDDICEIDFMKESFSLTESYDGKTFITSLAFNIPLNDQYGWAYRLLEFKDNKYAAILRTTNDNYIIVGVERGLFPSYTIETSEDDNVPNMVKVVFEQRSQYPILYTDEITQYRWVESEPLCFGFDRYQMLVKEKSEDWGETWVVVDPIVKKKGKIIETDSEACKEYQWVEDGEYCDIDNITYIKWENVDGFICEGGNKYHKTRRYVSEDGKSFSPSDEYGRGELIEEDSKECQYVAVRWIDDKGNYECYEVNEEYTRWIDNEEVCSGVTLYQGQYEEVSSNGIAYYESGENRLGDVIRDNCCACGYREEEWIAEDYVCGDQTNIQLLSSQGTWQQEGNTFIAPSRVTSSHTLTITGLETLNLLVTFRCSESQNVTIGVSYGDYSPQEIIVGCKEAPCSKIVSIPLKYGLIYKYTIKFTFNYLKSSYTFLDNVSITLLDFDNKTFGKYSKDVKHLICNDGVDVVDELTDDIKYHLTDAKSCDCGYTGTTYIYNNENVETKDIDVFPMITSFEKASYAICKLTEKTLNISSGDAKVYFSGTTKLNIKVKKTPTSQNSIISFYKIDREYEQVSAGTFPSYVHSIRSALDTNDVSIDVRDTNEHFIIIDVSGNSSKEDFVVEFENLSSKYINNAEYEIWRETKVCNLDDFTGNVFYKYLTDKNDIKFTFTRNSMTFKLNDTTYTATTSPYGETLENLGIDEITSCRQAFEGTSSFPTPISSLLKFPSTSAVTDMSYMFNYCTSLTSLDLSNFDTSNVIDMTYMFNFCRSLTSLDLSNFDTSKVTSMRYMFNECRGLTSLDLSSFDISNVTDISYMIYNCTNLRSLDLSSFDISNVANMGYMIYGCSNLTTFKYFKKTGSNPKRIVSDLGLTKLTSLDLSEWDTSNVTRMDNLFSGCGGLTSLDLSNFDTSNVTRMDGMFLNCYGLKSIDLSGWDMSNVTNTDIMFYNSSSIEYIYMRGCNQTTIDMINSKKPSNAQIITE